MAQLVARYLGVVEAVGSSPVTQTKIEYSCHSQSWILYFHIHIGTKRGVFMQAIDNEFFEAYKRLDRLCSDIYGCRNGVSQYIEDMDTNSFYDDIVLGCDPLTQLRRYQEDHLTVKKSAQRVKPVAMPTVSDHSDAARQPRRTGCFPVAILLLAGAVAIVIYFLAYLL